MKDLDAAATVYLVDAARVEGFVRRLQELDAEAESLYAGPAAEGLADVAPYIVTAVAGSAFSQWFFHTAWGQGAGMAVQSGAAPDDLRTHFRRFLMVMEESGKSLYFRFYDPRVLRIFLPTCDVEQVEEFFGPVDAFLVEDDDPAYAKRFTRSGGELVTERIDLSVGPQPARARIEWKGRR